MDAERVNEMQHYLKTWPVFFADVGTEAKTFEIRKNDRNFKVGDILILQEYEPEKDSFTGDRIHLIVNYMVSLDGLPDMPDGFVGMSVTVI